ncbi:hypothetical protein [Pseudoglutamicibacter cumminsii]|uniref:hypothetical protein n=1 Tax=Pseudoglutamicibacter cumminsii TaxID=156979 RepID=UPI00195B713A|nr:hypothetical protein [Pseudoglutamicibacter cumminsii]MBM7796563.1 hypothetical protein [Pseudoglutamicibacter cumminsii]
MSTVKPKKLRTILASLLLLAFIFGLQPAYASGNSVAGVIFEPQLTAWTPEEYEEYLASLNNETLEQFQHLTRTQQESFLEALQDPRLYGDDPETVLGVTTGLTKTRTGPEIGIPDTRPIPPIPATSYSTCHF